MMRTAWTVFRADLALEWAARERVLTMALFGLLSALVFHFTLFLDESVLDRVATGGLWVAFFFSATLGLGRTFVAEKEHGAFDAMLLMPAPVDAVYVGKTAGNFLLIFLTQVFVWSAFSLIFRLPVRSLGWLAALLGAFTLGVAALGTLLAAVSVHTKKREMLFPLLFFPLALPLIIAGAEGWAAALAGTGVGHSLKILSACAVLYLASGTVLFEHVARE